MKQKISVFTRAT